MNQKLIKVTKEDGSVFYERTRYLILFNIGGNAYRFKDPKGNIVEPTELELKLFNESQTGGAPVTNGWLTFIGLITLLNLIIQIIFLSRL